MYQNGFYQSPYAAPGNPYMERMAQMQQTTPMNGLIRVTGIDGAKAYQMPPNSSVALFDSGQDIFYVKTTDGAGFPTIRAFAFSPIQEQTPPAPTDYVTRAEFNELKEALINGKQPVRAESPGAADAAR